MSRREIRSLAVAVYGHLPTRTPSVEESDCFGVFHGLSTALGIADSPSADSTDSGLWGMNDAGGPWTGAEDAALCGWFQVGPPRSGFGPLPLVPFTATASATVGRFGAFTLSGLEYYVPLPSAAAEQWRLLSGRGWFGAIDPALRVPLRVTLDSGSDPDVAERSADVLDALHAMCPPGAVFGFEAADYATAVEFASPAPWRWWLGEGASHTFTLAVTAPEWAPIALGYAVAYVSEACRAVGIRAEIGVRVARG